METKVFFWSYKFLFLWKQLQLFTVCCHSERTVKMRILVFRTGSALHEKREYSFPVPEACYVKTWIVMGKCTLWLLVKLSLCLKIFLKLHYHEQLTVLKLIFFKIYVIVIIWIFVCNMLQTKAYGLYIRGIPHQLVLDLRRL